MCGDDIVKQHFTRTFRGYDVQEVDLFLDEVIRELERRDQERDELLASIENLLAALEERKEQEQEQP